MIVMGKRAGKKKSKKANNLRKVTVVAEKNMAAKGASLRLICHNGSDSCVW